MGRSANFDVLEFLGAKRSTELRQRYDELYLAGCQRFFHEFLPDRAWLQLVSDLPSEDNPRRWDALAELIANWWNRLAYVEQPTQFLLAKAIGRKYLEATYGLEIMVAPDSIVPRPGCTRGFSSKNGLTRRAGRSSAPGGASTFFDSERPVRRHFTPNP